MAVLKGFLGDLGEPLQLWVIDTENSTGTKIDIGSLWPSIVKISPDSTKIAFLAVDGETWSESEIWLVNMDGTELHKLTENENGRSTTGNFHWKPDCSWIVL